MQDVFHQTYAVKRNQKYRQIILGYFPDDLAAQPDLSYSISSRRDSAAATTLSIS